MSWLRGHVATVMVLGTGVTIGWLGRAMAYTSPALFASDAVKTGGGGGRSFTGAPGDGLDCGVCHRGGPAPDEILNGGPVGPYVPGATYEFDVAWPTGTHYGIAIAATDPAGAPLGALHVASGKDLLPQERCAGGGAAGKLLVDLPQRPVVLTDCGATRLRVQWTAPETAVAGSLYVSTVLGDGDETPEGDGVRSLVIPLATEETSGCAVSRGSPAWLLVLGLGWRRRMRRWSAAALGCLLLMGCARVQPHERGRLARPDMKLAPDADLSAGSEHALDYREGSAGGLGGGGGGCGCN